MRLLAVSALGQLGFAAGDALARLAAADDVLIAPVATRFLQERTAGS